jgi:hypothetical protein
MCSPQQAPAAEQKAVTELPEWAKPYGKDILAKGAALTDINQNPYQTYNQERLAGFSPMQQQAMQSAAGMQPSQQVAQGSGLAYGAGLGGLGMAMGATPQNFQSQVGGYMNPYLQYSLAPQLAEANRQYDIGATKQQSAATQAGAFGGSREAIMAAENERNRNMGLSSIIGQGYNTAYNQAQNQYNQAQQQALQGLGVGLQGASTLGQLGQTQYGQQMGINQLQAQYGGQQQAQMQKGLDTSYQDFLNQQNYPYKQLGFMSDLLRGTPTGSSSVTQMYQAPPSALQTVGALGMGAYGINQLSKMGANGGLMDSYADGGSVTSEENVKSIANFLPKEQVPKSLQMAQQRNDLDAQIALQKQMAENASLQRGLGSAFNSLPPQMQDGVVRAAGGGILAFKDGGESDEAPDLSSMFATRVADPRLQAQLGARQLALIDYLSKHQGVTPGTKEDRMKAQAEYIAEAQKAAGPSPYGDLNKNIEGQYAGISAERKLDEAAAAFEAIPAILEGNNALRGIAGGVAKFGGGIAKAAKNERLGRANLSEAQFKLKDAERKERMGLHHEARVAYDAGQKFLIDADKNATAAKSAAANATARAMAANKVSGGSGAGGAGSKEYVIGPAELLGQIKEEHPEWSPEKQKAEARRQYMAGKSAGYEGVATKVESTEQIKAREDFNTAKIMDSKNYRAAKGDPAKIAELDRKNAAAAGYKLPASHPAMQGANTPAPAPMQAPKDLNTFLEAARKANPGVSDADLTAYYNTKYKK